MAGKKKTAKTAARKAAPRKAQKRPTAAKRAAAAKPRFKARQEPETLRLRGVAPGFTVNDVHKSLAFYQDVLGFIVADRWEGDDGELRGVELRAGAVTFMLGQDDWKKGRDRVKGQGFRMFCSTAQDIDQLAAGIKARGGVLSEEPGNRSWGARDFSVTDPDGFKLTISTEYE